MFFGHVLDLVSFRSCFIKTILLLEHTFSRTYFNLIICRKPYLEALKLEADVFELVGCHKEDCSVSQVDYSCAAIWHKIMGSWSLAKAGEAALLAAVVVLGGLGDLGGLELLASADFAPVQKVAAMKKWSLEDRF